MKFGLNNRTGLNSVLTSWKSSEDPAPGEFSFGLDPRGSPQFFFYKSLSPYWRGGPWNGHTLSGLPDVGNRLKNNDADYPKEIDLFIYSFENNQNETSLSFSARNGTIPSILLLEPLGTVQRLIWRERGNSSKTWRRIWVAPEDLCDEYARCGPSTICNTEDAVQCTCLPGFKALYPHDWYMNCEEVRKDNCGKGKGEGFVKLENVKVPDARLTRLYANVSLKECERECLKSCNCTGYASSNVTVNGLGCIAWYGKLTDIRKYVDGQDFYLRVDAEELAASSRKNSTHSRARTLAFVVVPVVLLVFVLALCSSYLWRRNAKKKGPII